MADLAAQFLQHLFDRDAGFGNLVAEMFIFVFRYALGFAHFLTRLQVFPSHQAGQILIQFFFGIARKSIQTLHVLQHISPVQQIVHLPMLLIEKVHDGAVALEIVC